MDAVSAKQRQPRASCEQTIAATKKPEHIWNLVQNIKYVPDQFSRYKKSDDHLQPAVDTCRLQEGDCEDIAHLAATLLEKQGYETYRFVVHSKNEQHLGHAFVIFKDGERYSYFSVEAPLQFQETKEYKKGYKTIVSAIESIRPDWGMYGLFVEDKAQEKNSRYTEIWYRNAEQWLFFTKSKKYPPGKEFTDREDTIIHILE